MLLLTNNLVAVGQPSTPLPVELLSSNPSSYIELFEIDCSAISGISATYYVTSNKTSVVFGNITYIPFPIQVAGINVTSDGAPSRPMLSISNISDSSGTVLRFIGSLAFAHEDLIGAKVSYIRTFADYLNIPNSRISGPPLKFFIAKKTAHNKTILTFELRSPLDKERAYLPKRQMLKRDFPGLGINKNIQ